MHIYYDFKSAVKHRQLSYGYPREQTLHPAEAATQEYGILQFEYIVKHFNNYTQCSTYNPNNKEYDHSFPKTQYGHQTN